jgi:hypothetical protein
VVEDVPLGVDRTAAGDDACLAVDSHGDVAEEDSSVDGEVCDGRRDQSAERNEMVSRK